ncbi:unnamed protein product [Rotaria sordida]|uniref:PGAP2IP C-terminal nuclease-like domain-containing protein n=2 Tax=Rotaria sordida TaxID=392033 RepID=A0A819S1L7_9BILA|nr:unnamed protein product [Rotaria sordida]CAF4054430.1 unnamed protein product [Rotaria sordida]CAF4175678.1 unnamed protein product [Rotaria sordida]
MLLVKSQLIDKRKRFFFILPFGIAFLIACIGTYSRFLALPSTSLRKAEDPTYLTAAVWTVHFGYDNNARPSLDRVASVLADTIHYLLPSPEGELAPAILATIQTASKLIYIIIVHMGNDRDDLDRKLQEIKKIFIFYFSTNPLVFLGYITSEPFSRDYRRLTSVAKDIDPTDKDRWCQYILYKNLIHIGYARITHGSLTDTEIQMATFKIRTSEKFDDHSILVTDPSVVTEQSVLFNSKGHDYLNTHRFHMNTPKYFLAREHQTN